ncbi:glutamate-5-semialdehyde dehydrogenase [Legionella oakridgensis]|uniref:Gamma-glutamyl phosphate reductase n=2 Tax=Legionella oakridgensis TaxID=29423 RepID=W0BH19_9GAMM|nr:glutamate-5-semialdehyde dehydrogenase [Legionella oakridgensis]AHE67719.1 gamma-glutamyl phosphate reductase [Legionella oakridgensis ATCC 33761 = DSM 21215]ETO92727.1 glutamate-5-semialdehyde dehydrogenase [Legionella oakridgensis RV-2-2007]KTD36949.1 gamma-glutamyl phosphate reductase [Legionella oakridgensis]STY20742.1 gamma-glutamyl phosphate reductase [Legionella longbeachae]
MKEDLVNRLKRVKETSRRLIAINETMRQEILLKLAEHLRQACPKILQENHKDLALMAKDDPRYDRLLLTEERVYTMAEDVTHVASLPSVLHKTLSEKTMSNGLVIQKISVPLGVVSIIYESRPNVTVDVFALCFKTANACVLKGGKEAMNSNQYLVSLIHQTLTQFGIDPYALYLLPSERQALHVLLNAVNLVDVCIPRGSQALINFVRMHAQIPFIETGAGIVHTYFDKSGDLQKGQLIINNAKTRRVSVCNALDTLIIHEQRLTDLRQLVGLLLEKKVELFADEASYPVLLSFYPQTLLHKASPADFGREFLSYKMSIKTVSSVQQAIDHITTYTSGHSEAIITEDEAAATYFLQQVDAAAVYVNASTAFTDGGQFGMGAEIGISTQKLHARGPMALEALTSYKWLIHGNGQLRP